jgi:hypothetical protein
LKGSGTRVRLETSLASSICEVTHQAPTGIFTGPLEDKRRRLIHPAVVLMKLGARISTKWDEIGLQLTSLGECRFVLPSHHACP